MQRGAVGSALRVAAAVALSWCAPARAAGPCPLSAGRQGTVDDFLAEALAARQREDPTTSLACLSRAYTLEPSAGLLHNIARLFEDLGRYREAAEAYRRIGRAAGLDPALAQADAARLAALLPRLDRAWLRATLAPGAEARVDGDPIPSGEERDSPPRTVTLEVASGGVLHVTRVPLTAGVRLDLRLPEPERASEASLLLAPGTRGLSIDGREVNTPLDGISRVRLEAGGHTLAWTDAEGAQVRRAVTLAPGERWTAEVTPSGAPWLVPAAGGAATVGLAVTSAVLLGLAEADRRSIIEAERDADGRITGMTMVEATRLDERASARTAAGVGLMVGAAVALASTVLVTWLSAP